MLSNSFFHKKSSKVVLSKLDSEKIFGGSSSKIELHFQLKKEENKIPNTILYNTPMILLYNLDMGQIPVFFSLTLK